jgi:Tol biopolymer transport system component
MRRLNGIGFIFSCLVTLALAIFLVGCGGSSAGNTTNLGNGTSTGNGGNGTNSSSTTQDFGALTTRIIGAAQTPVFSQGVAGYLNSGGSVLGVAGATFTDISQSYAARNLGNTKIAFASSRDNNYFTEIYVMNTDGSGQTRLTNNASSDNYPVFSPDGTKIAFNSTRDGNNEIYVINADGSNQTRLTNNSATDARPSWSPDGTKIVFNSNRDGKFQIYTMNADGTNQTRLTNNTVDDLEPSFSPDGTKIAFVSNRDGNFEIYVMNADGTSQTRRTYNVASDFDPSWSPDGNKIVFYSSRDGNPEIYVMDVNGTETRLTNNAEDDVRPFFSPDGTKIVFEAHRDGNAEIYQMNTDGTGQIDLTNYPIEGDFHPSWSNYRRPQYIGANGILGTSCAGFLQGTQRQLNSSILIFDTVGSTLTGRGAARITANTNVDTSGPSLAFTITTSVGLGSIKFVNILESLTPITPTIPAGSTNALVLFDASNGYVTNVVPFTANRSVSPPQVDGNLVTYSGHFTAVFDATGKNLAPNGATSVTLDEKEGKLVRFDK